MKKTILIISVFFVLNVIFLVFIASNFAQNNKVFFANELCNGRLSADDVTEITIRSVHTPETTTFKDRDLIERSVGLLEGVVLKKNKPEKDPYGFPMLIKIKTKYDEEYTITFGKFGEYQTNKNISDDFQDLYKKSSERNGTSR